jgi:hypothetical protein
VPIEYRYTSGPEFRATIEYLTTEEWRYQMESLEAILRSDEQPQDQRKFMFLIDQLYCIAPELVPERLLARPPIPMEKETRRNFADMMRSVATHVVPRFCALRRRITRYTDFQKCLKDYHSCRPLTTSYEDSQKILWPLATRIRYHNRYTAEGQSDD